MDNLFGPQLNLVQATDKWTQDLRHLNQVLDKHNKTLTGSSDVAIKNRAAMGGLFSDYEAVATAGAAAGETSAQFTGRLHDQYDAMLKAAVAARGV